MSRGLAEFHELSFETGEILMVVSTELESEYPAWGIASKLSDEAQRGLVPLEYLDLARASAIVTHDTNDTDAVNSAGYHPYLIEQEEALEMSGYTQNTSRHSVQASSEPPRFHDLLRGRELNRFSTFVTSGVEVVRALPSIRKVLTAKDYLLKDTSVLCSPSRKEFGRNESEISGTLETFYIEVS